MLTLISYLIFSFANKFKFQSIKSKYDNIKKFEMIMTSFEKIVCCISKQKQIVKITNLHRWNSESIQEKLYIDEDFSL